MSDAETLYAVLLTKRQLNYTSSAVAVHLSQMRCDYEVSGAVASALRDAKPNTLAEEIETMEPHERMLVFDALRAAFCLHCGGDAGCRCWDDS